jgi:hypothetical protein
LKWYSGPPALYSTLRPPGTGRYCVENGRCGPTTAYSTFGPPETARYCVENEGVSRSASQAEDRRARGR